MRDLIKTQQAPHFLGPKQYLCWTIQTSNQINYLDFY